MENYLNISLEVYMYGRGGGLPAVLGTATIASGTIAGAVLLPNTGNNILGIALATTAIAVGVLALISQVIVRIVRKSN